MEMFRKKFHDLEMDVLSVVLEKSPGAWMFLMEMFRKFFMM